MKIKKLGTRYKIKKTLGQGGSSIVLLGEDLKDKKNVAIKILQNIPSTSNILSKEFELLSEIDHKSIVKVFEYGISETGKPFLVMEPIMGLKITDYLKNRNIIEIYEVIYETCLALDYLHSRGLIHGDIKPGNILISNHLQEIDNAKDVENIANNEHYHNVKLLDFGLAIALGSETREGIFGTLDYIAPEILAGEPYTSSCDLYSFGVLLYEIFTGRKPFKPTKNIHEQLRRKVSIIPKAPDISAPKLPRDLSNLIMRLLSRIPNARPKTFKEILQTIRHLPNVGLKSKIFQEGIIPQKISTPNLVGRNKIIIEVQKIINQTTEKPNPVLVAISGDEGLGKTRLLDHFSTQIQSKGYITLYTKIKSSYSNPFEAIINLLPHYKSEIKSLSEESGTSIEYSNNFAFFQCYVDLLKETLQNRRFAIILDDCHYLHEKAAELIRYICITFRIDNPLIFLTYKKDENSKEKLPIENVINYLSESYKSFTSSLKPIDNKDMRHLITSAFNMSHSAGYYSQSIHKLPDILHKYSDGKPKTIKSILDAIVENDLIIFEDGEWKIKDDLNAIENYLIKYSGDPLQYLINKVDVLDPQKSRIIRQIAVLGSKSPRWLLHSVIETRLSSLNEAIASGIEVGILTEDNADRISQISFIPPILSEMLSTTVAEGKRVELHLRAASILQDTSEIHDMLKTVEHLLAAKRNNEALAVSVLTYNEARTNNVIFQQLKACELSVLCAEYCGLKGHRFAELKRRLGEIQHKLGYPKQAIQSFEDALKHLDKYDVKAAKIQSKIGELACSMGEYDRSIELLSEACTTLESKNERTSGERSTLAWTYIQKGDYIKANQMSGFALEAAQSTMDIKAEAIALKTIGKTLWYEGNYQPAIPKLSASIKLFRQINNETGLADALIGMGNVKRMLGDYDESINAYDTALTLFEKHQALPMIAKCLNNIGIVNYLKGDWPNATRNWEKFLNAVEKLGDQTELITCLNNLGFMYKNRGHMGQSQAAFERGLKLSKKLGLQRLNAVILGNLGELFFDQQHYELSQDYYTKCKKLTDKIGIEDVKLECCRREAELYCALENNEKAIKIAESALKQAVEKGTTIEEGYLLKTIGEALYNSGEIEKAKVKILQALEIFNKLDTPLETGKVKMVLVRLFLSSGEPDNAYEHLITAEKIFERLGAITQLRNIKKLHDRLGGGRELLKNMKNLKILVDINRDLSTKLELEDLLETIVERAINVTDAEAGFLILFNDLNEWSVRVAKNISKQVIEGNEFQFSRAIIDNVYKESIPVFISDVVADGRFATRESVMSLGIMAIMATPIKHRGKTVGVIYVHSTTIRESFCYETLSLLEALASQAGAAIENARLFTALSSKTEMLGVIAHELRKPLSGIMGYAYLLKEDDGTAEMDYLSIITNESHRMNRMIDEFLELSTMEANRIEWYMERLNILEVVKDSVTLLNPQANMKNIIINREYLSEEIPTIKGSRDRLCQVLTNLLENAIKYTPNGGKILVTTKIAKNTEANITEDRTNEKWIENLDEESEQFDKEYSVVVSVQDNGPGIDEETAKNVFNKYSRADSLKNKIKGTGLGLYIAAEITKRHRGKIWVESVPEQGSKFSISLPLYHGDEEEEEEE